MNFCRLFVHCLLFHCYFKNTIAIYIFLFLLCPCSMWKLWAHIYVWIWPLRRAAYILWAHLLFYICSSGLFLSPLCTLFHVVVCQIKIFIKIALHFFVMRHFFLSLSLNFGFFFCVCILFCDSRYLVLDNFFFYVINFTLLV